MKKYFNTLKEKITSFWIEVKYNKELPSAIMITISIVLCMAMGFLFLCPLVSIRNATLIGLCIVGGIGIILEPYLGVLFVIFLYFLMSCDIKYAPSDTRAIFYITPVVVGSWLFNMIVKRNFRFVKCWQNIAILGLIAVAYLSTINAVYPEKSIEESNVFGKRMIFYLLFLNLTDSFKKLNLAYWIVSGGSGCLSLLAIRTFILGGSMKRTEVGGGQLKGSNALAHMVVMTIPFFFYKIFSKNQLERIAGIIFLPISIFCIIATGSRGGSIGAGVVLLSLALNSKKKLKSFLILSGVIWLGIMFAPPIYWERMNTIKTYEEDASATHRIDVWKAGIEMWKEHPLIGIGQENFQYVVRGYLPWDSNIEQLVPHNTYIKFLAQGGTITLFSYLLLLFFNFTDLWRVRKSAKEEFQGINVHNLSRALEIGLIGHMISGIFIDKTDFEPFYWFSALAALLRYFLKYEDGMAKEG
ncbi:MAG: O-antigen ligase family protein [bacterium]